MGIPEGSLPPDVLRKLLENAEPSVKHALDSPARRANDANFKIKKKPELKAPQNHVGDKVFTALCKHHGLPAPVEEYYFARDIGRNWHVDWIFDGWLVLEVEGAVHRIKDKFHRDIEKYNELALRGYVLLRCTNEDMESGAVFDLLKRAFQGGESS